MHDSLTRNGIYEIVKQRLGLSYAESHRLLDHTFSLIRDALRTGGDVKVARFGVFVLHHKKPRLGRNPKTKREVTIGERYSVSFRASGILKERIEKNAPKAGDTAA